MVTTATAAKTKRKPTVKNGTPLSYYLGLIPIILLACAAIYGSWRNNTPEGLLIRSQELDIKKIEAETKKLEVVQNQSQATPIYLAPTFGGNRNVDYTPQSRHQPCSSQPKIGWGQILNLSMRIEPDKSNGVCLDYSIPSGSKILILFRKKAVKITGNFLVEKLDGTSCNTVNVSDNCQEFIGKSLNDEMRYTINGNGNIFIQPALFDRRI